VYPTTAPSEAPTELPTTGREVASDWVPHSSGNGRPRKQGNRWLETGGPRGLRPLRDVTAHGRLVPPTAPSELPTVIPTEVRQRDDRRWVSQWMTSADPAVA
jgi:hypothetical protein